MHWNIVELAENGRYAKVDRGFLVVNNGETELGKVVLDELTGLIISADQATISKPLIVRLAELGVPIIFCGRNYQPISITLPYSNHHHSTGILQRQISASKPLKKRLWQQLIKQKINHQIWSLVQNSSNQAVLNRLQRLVKQVKSGDPDNCEAQAAKIYWQALFTQELGNTFRRNHQAKDFANSALNYGYMVLRSAMARATCAAGLQPALGLHHHNQGNPFCLVDDLMEPFRPLVDKQVATWLKRADIPQVLKPKHKQKLTRLLTQDMLLSNQLTPVSKAMQYLAFSLVKSLESGEPSLNIAVTLTASTNAETAD